MTAKFIGTPGVLPTIHPSLQNEPQRSTLLKFVRFANYFTPSHRDKNHFIYYHYLLPKHNESTQPVESVRLENVDDTAESSEGIDQISELKPSDDNGFLLQSISEYKHHDKLKGILLFIHGYADHSTRLVPYLGLDKFVSEFNFAFCGIDHEGHGLSSGVKGYVPSIPQIAQDIQALIKEQFPRDFSKPLPIYLLGHSMGGLVSLELLRMESALFKAAVLSSPLLVPAPESTPPKIVQHVASFASKLSVLGKLALIEGNKGKIYTNPEYEIEFLEDPLTYSGRLRVGTGISFLNSFSTFTDEQLKQISSSIPCYVQFGDKDRSCDVSGAHRLGACGFKKSIYKDMAHELFREPCYDVMIEELQKFIFEHIDKQS